MSKKASSRPGSKSVAVAAPLGLSTIPAHAFSALVICSAKIEIHLLPSYLEDPFLGVQEKLNEFLMRFEKKEMIFEDEEGMIPIIPFGF
jgi:hypothetical protein